MMILRIHECTEKNKEGRRRVIQATESNQVAFPCLLQIRGNVSCFKKRESKRGLHSYSPIPSKSCCQATLQLLIKNKREQRIFWQPFPPLQLPNYTRQECLLCCSLLTDWRRLFFQTVTRKRRSKKDPQESEMIYHDRATPNLCQETARRPCLRCAAAVAVCA